jgi:hypothetical protein
MLAKKNIVMGLVLIIDKEWADKRMVGGIGSYDSDILNRKT